MIVSSASVGGSPSFGTTDPSSGQFAQYKNFQRDEASESHGGYGFQALEIKYLKIFERCRKKRLRPMII